MRFEHGSLRAECLAALIILLCCCCCSAAEEGAPPPPFRGPRTFRQCLRLDEGVGPREACGAQGRHVRLRYCDAYEPARLALDPCDGPALDRLRRLDDSAREAACRFRQLIERYDCENANSVSWTCKDCEEAYKQWVCAMFLPPVRVEGGGGGGMKPCRYICRLVEQRCPYFHPSVRDQYAGERVFKCIDPDIPDLDAIQGVSSYGPPNRCYCPQHLGASINALEEAECRLLSHAQLQRRNASASSHHHRASDARTLTPASLTLLALALLTTLFWTR